jgi:hypothetical protein
MDRSTSTSRTCVSMPRRSLRPTTQEREGKSRIASKWTQSLRCVSILSVSPCSSHPISCSCDPISLLVIDYPFPNDQESTTLAINAWAHSLHQLSISPTAIAIPIIGCQSSSYTGASPMAIVMPCIRRTHPSSVIIISIYFDGVSIFHLLDRHADFVTLRSTA